MASCKIRDKETGEIIDLGECRDEYECSVKALEYVNRQLMKE